LGGYGVFACSCLISARKTSPKKGASWVALFWRVLQGFNFGKLSLHLLPHARIEYIIFLKTFYPAFGFILEKFQIDKKKLF